MGSGQFPHGRKPLFGYFVLNIVFLVNAFWFYELKVKYMSGIILDIFAYSQSQNPRKISTGQGGCPSWTVHCRQGLWWVCLWVLMSGILMAPGYGSDTPGHGVCALDGQGKQV